MAFGYGEGPGKQHRTILDFGPTRPVWTEKMPDRPDASLSENSVAWIEYRNAQEGYQSRRAVHTEAMRVYREWHEAHAGAFPVPVLMPIVDAKEAVERDPERYRFHFEQDGGSDAA